LVFRLPPAIGPIAYQNKALVYGLLLKAAADTLTTVAADHKYLGARIGITAVLHSWGRALQHHPHVHCIVPAGGISLDGTRWIGCTRGSFLPVRVLSRVFRCLFLEKLTTAYDGGELQFWRELVALKEGKAFDAALAPLRTTEWVVHAKEASSDPKQVFRYLSRYTHRVAITNKRLVDVDDTHVRFCWKDYQESGRHKHKVVRLEIAEFIRRFLLHVLPDGFQRIRHYGFLANSHRADKLALCRRLLDAPSASTERNNDDDKDPGVSEQEPLRCPCCGLQAPLQRPRQDDWSAYGNERHSRNCFSACKR
jgi:hypothetical protein